CSPLTAADTTCCLSLHDALPISSWVPSMIQSNFGASPAFSAAVSMVLPLVNLTGAYLAGWLDRVPRTPASESTTWRALEAGLRPDRKSTRLNSSHVSISYAVFCL